MARAPTDMYIFLLSILMIYSWLDCLVLRVNKNRENSFHTLLWRLVVAFARDEFPYLAFEKAFPLLLQLLAARANIPAAILFVFEGWRLKSIFQSPALKSWKPVTLSFRTRLNKRAPYSTTLRRCESGFWKLSDNF